MIKAVIFDVDGTLIDSVDAHARSWVAAFQEFGHEVSFERVRRQIGKGADQLMPAFLPEEAIAQEGEALDARQGEIFRARHLAHIRPFPRVRSLFERILAEGLQIALASSAKGEDLEDYKRIAGVQDLVAVETTSDSAEASKPEPDIFQAALDRLPGVAAREALIVGDTPWDAQAAARAGIPSIGVRCGGWEEEPLKAAGALAVYDAPAALLEAYGRSPLAPGFWEPERR